VNYLFNITGAVKGR